MVRAVMATNRINQRHMTHKTILRYMATKMESFVHHVMTNHGDREHIARIGTQQQRSQSTEDGTRNDQHDQYTPREKYNPKLFDAVNGEFVISKVLVMLARMTIKNRA